MPNRVVVVGATGAVGTQILRILEERNFPIEDLLPVASQRSAGRRIEYRGRQVEVVALAEDVFAPDDLALFDVPDEVSHDWAPIAAAAGATVIDNSGAFRMEQNVPLVVPEVNPEEANERPRGIIASPNCTTLAMVVPLAALHRADPVERLILSSYQAASGAGKPGVDELWDQTEKAVKQPEESRDGRAGDILEGGETFVHPIALNVIPRCGSVKNDGYTSEEIKLCLETRKIMSLPDLPVTATCVRVPVITGHGVSVHAEFRNGLEVEAARRILKEARGVELLDDVREDVYPTPLIAAGRDACYVGRIRRDLFNERALEFFCVADNLRKGAALNTVQIAELLVG